MKYIIELCDGIDPIEIYCNSHILIKELLINAKPVKQIDTVVANGIYQCSIVWDKPVELYRIEYEKKI